MIKLPENIDMIALIKKVYELSVPLGMGFLHFMSAPMTDEHAKEILSCQSEGFSGCILSLDYIQGRSCKFHVYKEKDGLYINDSWYDHTDAQFNELLKTFNIEAPTSKDHGCSCACSDCKSKRDTDDVMGLVDDE